MAIDFYTDIDGVFNDHGHIHMNGGLFILPRCVQVFNAMMTRWNPRIVIISSWRWKIISGEMSPEGFKFMLQTHGIIVNELTYTPEMYQHPDFGARAAAIRRMVAERKADRWAVLDDVKMDVDNQIVPDGQVGLVPRDVLRLSRILDK